MIPCPMGLDGWTQAMVAQGWVEERIGAWVVVLILAAGVSVWTGRVVHARLNSVLLIFSVSTAIALAATWVRGTRLSPLQQVAESCAVLALLWSSVAFPRSRNAQSLASPGDSARTFASLVQLTALLFAAAGAIPLLLTLVMRLVLVSVDLLHGYPSPPLPSFGFEAVGLWSFALLGGTCVLGWMTTREGRLPACGFWIVAAAGTWASLLIPAFRLNPSGGFERSGMSLVLLAAYTTAIAVAAVCTRVNDARRNAVAGLRTSTAVLATLVIVLGCYHLLIPVQAPWGGLAGARLWVAGCLGLCSFSMFAMLALEWREGLADAGMGTASLAACAAVLAITPMSPGPLSESYPQVFNAIIVALALATAGWTAVSCGLIAIPRWEAGVATDRLASHAKRFAFLCSALALVAAALMTYWPRIPAIASMDHSFGRVMSGFGAHLLLLLVMLWSSRRLQRLTFHLLTLLAVVSTVGFLVVRVVPFASKVG